MAIFSLNVKIISRGTGGSIVGHAAYILRARIYDDYYGEWHNHTRRQDAPHKGILLPEHTPNRLQDLRVLLTELNAAEKRKDSQMAQSFKLALPIELPEKEQLLLVKEFCQKNFIEDGRCVIYAIHSGKMIPDKIPSSIPPVVQRTDNPHAHLLVPIRRLDAEGFCSTKTAKRERNWHTDLRSWREHWADLQNDAYERFGLDVRVSHKSLADQGIDRTPSIHVGQIAIAKEQRGELDKRVDRYLQILSENPKDKHLQKLLQEKIMEREKHRKQQRENERFQELVIPPSRERTSPEPEFEHDYALCHER